MWWIIGITAFILYFIFIQCWISYLSAREPGYAYTEFSDRFFLSIPIFGIVMLLSVYFVKLLRAFEKLGERNFKKSLDARAKDKFNA